MGRVKSELFDWYPDEDEPWPDYQRHLEIMDDPVLNEWHRKNFKESVEQQGYEREFKEIVCGKGDRYRPVNREKFNENFSRIFRQKKKEKSNDRQSDGNANRDS